MALLRTCCARAEHSFLSWPPELAPYMALPQASHTVAVQYNTIHVKDFLERLAGPSTLKLTLVAVAAQAYNGMSLRRAPCHDCVAAALSASAPWLSSAASCAQGAPDYDYPSSTLILNITVISDPSALKFRDGIARQTYQNALTPNQFAKVRSAAGLPQPCFAVLAGLPSGHPHWCSVGARVYVLAPYHCLVWLGEQGHRGCMDGRWSAPECPGPYL